MGRRVSVIGLLLAVSCAAPPIRLSPAFPPGQQRTYSLDAEAVTVTTTSAGARTETTRLTGRSVLDLIEARDDGVKARIHMIPASLTRDGAPIETPDDQTADILIRPDNTIEVLGVDGVPGSLSPVGAEDLAGLLGPPMPGRALEPGERFGSEGVAGRVSALRVVGGFPCAIVRLGTERQIERRRQDDGREVFLRGTEVSDIEMAFAIKEGFPVRISTTAEAPLSVLTNERRTGQIIVRSVTVLELIEPRAR